MKQCPECNSNNIEARGFWWHLFFGLIISGLSFFIILIPPAFIVAFITGVVSIIISPLQLNKKKCKNCGNKFR